jgi:hypothetical protein
MALVTGTVDATNDNYGKVNINVAGKWYSTKREWWKGNDPVVGDNVTFDDGGRNYIKNYKVSSGAPAPASGGGSAPPRRYEKTFPIAALDPSRAINRQNALTNAVNFVTTTAVPEASPDDVIQVARLFEAYTTGDLDAEEAQAMLDSMGG